MKQVLEPTPSEYLTNILQQFSQPNPARHSASRQGWDQHQGELHSGCWPGTDAAVVTHWMQSSHRQLAGQVTSWHKPIGQRQHESKESGAARALSPCSVVYKERRWLYVSQWEHWRVGENELWLTLMGPALWRRPPPMTWMSAVVKDNNRLNTLENNYETSKWTTVKYCVVITQHYST